MGGREGWFAGTELACEAELKLNDYGGAIVSSVIPGVRSMFCDFVSVLFPSLFVNKHSPVTMTSRGRCLPIRMQCTSCAMPSSC